MKKQRLRRGIAALLTVVMTSASPFTALADGWQGQTGNWQYTETSAQGMEESVRNSWRKIDGLWYHFDTNGKMQTGWYQDEKGTWFYLNQYGEGVEGSMRTGWYQDSSSGNWYYLNPQVGSEEGAMMTGWITDNGVRYYLGADGVWIPEMTENDDSDSDSRTEQPADSGDSSEQPSDSSTETEDGSGTDDSMADDSTGSADDNTDNTGNASDGTEDETNPPSDDDTGDEGEDSGDVIMAKSNVIAFDLDLDEGQQEVAEVYEELYDYWTDDMGTDDTADDEYNLLVGNDNPLYLHILDGVFEENCVMYIPACEYFPAGVSLVYLYHDDAYDGLMSFDPDDYEVIHTRPATLGDIIDDEISLSLDEVNEDNPVSFFWIPEYSDSESGASFTIHDTDLLYASENTSESTSVASTQSGSSSAVDNLADYGPSETVKNAGWQLQNLTTALVPTVDFDNIHEGKIGLKMNNLVIYDKDGDKETKYDRVTISGSVTMEDIDPLVDLEWNPKLSDPLPKQFIAKLSYVEKNNAKATFGGELGSLSKLTSAAGFGKFENFKRVLGMDIQGVDMDDSLIIAAAGINIGTRVPQIGIKSIQYESVFVPLTPTFLVLFTLDVSGQIKATVVGQYDSTTYVEKGVNCQKDGFVGRNGTCAENVGQSNYRIGDRNINIYDLAAKSSTEKNKPPVSTITVAVNGEASAEAGVGVGAGIMLAGVMPFMLKGTPIGLETSLKGNAKGIYSSETGFDVEGELTGRAALISKLTADLKLTIKTFLGNPGITGSWELAKYTWLEATFSTVGVSGTVMKSDSDRDATNNPVLEGATVEVTLKNTAAGTAKYKTAETDAQGAFSISNLETGTYTIKVSKSGYLTYEGEISVKAGLDPLSIYLDEAGSLSSIHGTVREADEDTNASNNPALAGVTVTATKINSSSTSVKTAETDAQGSYSFADLPTGLYELVFEKNGYITVRDEIEVRSSSVTYNAVMEIISNSYAGQGTASGTIVNALTGGNVGSGVSLRITKDVNISNADTVTTTRTDANGAYSVTLAAGIYTVWLTDSRTTPIYQDDSFTIKVLGNCTITDQNGEMTPILDDEEIRIVLTWGSVPRDLDSHLSGPLSNGGRFHTYYSNKNAKDQGVLVANLDVDDVTSYGPETTTIYHQTPGIYRYSVHNYTNRSSSNSSALANSGAYVRVYKGGDTQIRSFYVPNSPGTVWNVFDYDSSTGEITPLNTMEYQSNPSAVSYYSGTSAASAISLLSLEEDEDEIMLSNDLGDDTILPLSEIGLKDYELATASNATPADAEYASPGDAEEAGKNSESVLVASTSNYDREDDDEDEWFRPVASASDAASDQASRTEGNPVGMVLEDIAETVIEFLEDVVETVVAAVQESGIRNDFETCALITRAEEWTERLNE